EIRLALHAVRISSSPGLDGINRFIKALPGEILSCLLSLLNLIFSSSIFPAQWSHSIVHLISKPHSAGYRPISLTSCILKLREHMILNLLAL
ncbi:hypothetical protein ALC56_03922, partial [Trachymyrmex septentrionalis]